METTQKTEVENAARRIAAQALLEKMEKEKKLRKRVFESVMQLLEPVSEQDLQKLLQNMDCNSWDEAIEERSLAKLCGWPLCGNTVSQRKHQKYHIDRKAKKVYEMCTDRAKFCGSKCFDKSTTVKAQLPTEALWITGKRTEMQFSWDVSDSSISSFNWDEKNIEFVKDKVIAKLSSLKVAERASSSEDEGNDSEEERENDMFTTSIKRFVGFCGSEPVVSTKEANTPNGTKSSKQQEPVIPSLSPKQTKINEEKKLDRLRSKYGTTKGKRAVNMDRKPIVIDPITPYDVIAEGGRGTTVIETLVQKEQGIVNNPNDLLHSAGEVVRGWLGDRTRELIRMGGARPVTETDRLMRRFYAGDLADQREELESVRLPNVDFVDVAKRRTEILIDSLKRPWSTMERRFGLSHYRSGELLSLVRSFELNSENIAGFSPSQLHAFCIIIWRIVCMMCPEEESSFFPLGIPTESIKEHLKHLKIDYDNYCKFIREIEIVLNYDEITQNEILAV